MFRSREPFKLSVDFVEKYKYVKPEFGYNGLGEVVYRRTYSRVRPDGTNEEWYQIVDVMNLIGKCVVSGNVRRYVI